MSFGRNQKILVGTLVAIFLIPLVPLIVYLVRTGAAGFPESYQSYLSYLQIAAPATLTAGVGASAYVKGKQQAPKK